MEKTKVFIRDDFDIPIYKKGIKPKNNKTILVLSGGGVKGIAHIGALKALNELNYLRYIDTYCGTSVGALICSLLIIGYSLNELYEFIMDFNLDQIKSLCVENFIYKFGFDDGNNFNMILKKMFITKKIDPSITLNELYCKTKKKLIVTTVCVNENKVEYMSYENFPNMQVILAIRMSTCIPFFFSPIKYNKKLYIDGSVFNSFPIDLFKNKLNKVIGIKLINKSEEFFKIKNLDIYIYNVLKCIFYGKNDNYNDEYVKYTIYIDTKDISILDFSLDCKKKHNLYKYGYNTIYNIIKK